MNKMKFCKFTDEECIYEEGKGDCSICDYNYTRNDNTCVCCGKIIPEGRQVCYQCEYQIEKAKTTFVSSADALKNAFNKIVEAFKTFWESIKIFFREYLESILRVPKNKRDPLQRRFMFYISKVLGKSNNWRKIHHIPMARRGK